MLKVGCSPLGTPHLTGLALPLRRTASCPPPRRAEIAPRSRRDCAEIAPRSRRDRAEICHFAVHTVKQAPSDRPFCDLSLLNLATIWRQSGDNLAIIWRRRCSTWRTCTRTASASRATTTSRRYIYPPTSSVSELKGSNPWYRSYRYRYGDVTP